MTCAEAWGNSAVGIAMFAVEGVGLQGLFTLLARSCKVVLAIAPALPLSLASLLSFMTTENS